MSKAYNKIVEKRLQEERPILQNKAMGRPASSRVKSRASMQTMQGNRSGGCCTDGRPHTTNKARRKSLRANKPTTSMQSLPSNKKKRGIPRVVDAAFANLVCAGFKGARSLKAAVRNFNRAIMEYKRDAVASKNSKDNHV